MPENNRERRVVVVVEFRLREDGSLRGRPRVVSPTNYRFDESTRDAVNSALAAVRACSPYPFASDPIAADHYDMWREQRYHFSAR
jgi:hypothetical protein